MVDPTSSGSDAVTLTCTPDPVHFSVNEAGTEYTIKTATGWDVFCDLLAENNKGYFTGKTVLLGDDISVTRMAGGSYHDFTGTFDGQGHTLTVSCGSETSPINEDKAAPFRNVEGNCVIKNLRTAGTIFTSKKYASGFIGTQYGSVTVKNCRRSMKIKSSTNGDGTHGGYIGNAGGSVITIEGCVFDGKILSVGDADTTRCSGFVGYRINTVDIINSVYAPAALETGENEASIDSATFVRNGSAGENCYYTRALGSTENQGKQAYSISAAERFAIALSGEATVYSVSGITVYDGNSGIKYDGTYYAEENAAVTLRLSHANMTGWTFNGYTADKGTLVGADNPFILDMPAESVTISGLYEQIDYAIICCFFNQHQRRQFYGFL